MSAVVTFPIELAILATAAIAADVTVRTRCGLGAVGGSGLSTAGCLRDKAALRAGARGAGPRTRACGTSFRPLGSRLGLVLGVELRGRQAALVCVGWGLCVGFEQDGPMAIGGQSISKWPQG